MPTVPAVDLERFMGDWFVIEAIPASSEREAYNGVESYRMREDGQIATTYAFRDGGFDGKLKVMEPVGCVDNKTTNATWGMQFFWPFHAEYLIVYLNPEYTETIIGRTKRDYVWIMARTPDLPAARLEALEAEVERLGYDRTKLRRVPQRWPDPGHPYSAPTR
ncbi:MAG: lipocalin family protein [Planctomycetes bacterium]|nr:lipocalin family protein [Planctomycetota bacterium]